MTTTAAGITTTTVSTDQLAPLGFELVIPAASGSDSNAGNGQQVWVYILCDETLAIGDVVEVNGDWVALIMVSRVTKTHLKSAFSA